MRKNTTSILQALTEQSSGAEQIAKESARADKLASQAARGMAELKIVVLSGSSEPSDVQRARDLGAADYVDKPIKPEKIRELLSHKP